MLGFACVCTLLLLAGASGTSEAEGELVLQRGHRGVATALDAGGDIVVTAGEDGSVRVWSKEGLVRILMSSRAAIRAVRLSADHRLAAACDDAAVGVWDVASGEQVAQWDWGAEPGSLTTCTALAWSPDGGQIAISARALRVHDAHSGAIRWEARSERPMFRALDWGGDLIAAGLSDGAIELREAGSGRLANVLPAPGASGLSAVRFSPDGGLVAAAYLGMADERGGSAVVWEARSGSQLYRAQPGGPRVRDVSWSPDGARLVVPYSNGVNVVDGRTGAPVWTRTVTNRGFVGAGLVGSALWALSKDGGVTVWPEEDAYHARGWPADVDIGLDVSATPDRVAVAGCDGLRLWERGSLRMLPRVSSCVVAARLSPTSEQLIRADGDGSLTVVEAGPATTLRTLTGRGPAIRAVSWSPDGTRVAAGSEDGRVHLWDVTTGDLLATMHAHTYDARALAWSPEGRLLATGGPDGLRFWHTSDGTEDRRLTQRGGAVLALAWSAEEGLAVATEGAPVEILAPESGAVRAVPAIGTALAWNLPGRQLAIAARDGSVSTWDAATGLAPVQSRGARINGVAWSGDVLVTTGAETRLHRLTPAAGVRLIALPSTAGFVGLAIAEDGRFFGSAEALLGLRRRGSDGTMLRVNSSDSRYDPRVVEAIGAGSDSSPK
jgi:WD40 repeat protein